MKQFILGFSMAVLAFSRAAAQTNPEQARDLRPDLQKMSDRLDQLEADNQHLRDEIRQLREELSAVASAPPSAASNTAAPPTAPDAVPQATTAERLDVAEARTAELAQTKVETSQKLPVSLTGMLLFNAFHNGRYGGSLQDPLSAALNPGSANDGASFRQTVIGLKFYGPDLPGGGKASGSVFFDFFAGTAQTYNNLFRIRVATLDLKWRNTTITVGQDKPIITPREPDSLAQVGYAPLTAAGNLWYWDPQVRIEQRFAFGEKTGLLAQAGVYQMSETNYLAPASVVASLSPLRPAGEGRFEFFHESSGGQRIEVAPSVHFSTTHVDGTSVDSKAFSLDWLVKPASFAQITGAWFKGQDLAGLGALPQGFNVLPSGAVIPVHSDGGWAQLALFPAARFTFHFYGGEEHDRGADLSPGGLSRNFVYAGNIFYKLAPNILLSLETGQTRTQRFGSLLRLNNHYDLALAYLF